MELAELLVRVVTVVGCLCAAGIGLGFVLFMARLIRGGGLIGPITTMIIFCCFLAVSVGVVDILEGRNPLDATLEAAGRPSREARAEVAETPDLTPEATTWPDRDPDDPLAYIDLVQRGFVLDLDGLPAGIVDTGDLETLTGDLTSVEYDGDGGVTVIVEIGTMLNINDFYASMIEQGCYICRDLIRYHGFYKAQSIRYVATCGGVDAVAFTMDSHLIYEIACGKYYGSELDELVTDVWVLGRNAEVAYTPMPASEPVPTPAPTQDPTPEVTPIRADWRFSGQLIINTDTMTCHRDPWCTALRKSDNSPHITGTSQTLQELEAAGYQRCGMCYD